MGRPAGEAITVHLPPMPRLPPPAAFTGIPHHSAPAASGSAAAGITGTMVGTMAGTTGTVTTVITGIGMTAEGAEGTGTVARAEGIQEATAGIAEIRDR